MIDITPDRRAFLLGVLVFDAVMFAAVELLYLPLRLGPLPLPLSIVLAGLSTPWLVRCAAGLGGPSALASLPLLAWVASVLVIGVAGPGGDVLLPADWRSLTLLAVGIFPGAVALGRALARDLDPQRRPAG